MTPKLLQKKSNRFLQLALPENLIANKRIGKREKYNHRPGTAANNLRGVEKRILGQWALSWNMYKKIREKQQSLRRDVSTMEKTGHPGLFPRARFISLALTFPFFLVTPGLYILHDKISRALGGNVIHYLKSTVNPQGGEATPMAPVKASANYSAPPCEARGAAFSRDKACYSLPSLETLLSCSTDLIGDAPVDCFHMRGEMVTEHCRKNHFNMIYPAGLPAQILQNKGGRRDRIADRYRNQLAEWRKIAFLYGGLPRQAALRLHRRAYLMGGDVDSNFLCLLESRLDVTLKRAFFFSTLKAARQWIQRGKIYVNNQPRTFAGAILQPADIITISPCATMEWRKERLLTLAAIREKADQWNKNRISHGAGPLSRYPGTGWGNHIPPMLRNPRVSRGGRRFPFSPALMRKWKEWSKIWSNSRYSFSERHSWRSNLTGAQHFINPRSDRFTGAKPWQRSTPGGGSQPSYSSSRISLSCLSNYLSATNSRAKGQSLSENFLEYPQINYPASSTQQSTTPATVTGFSLLERRQTYITSLIYGLTTAKRSPGAISSNNQERRFPATAQRNGGVKGEKSGETPTQLIVPLRRCANRLGQVIGGERKGRCQWLHQRQSAVVDGLYALRWSRGFARKKSLGEKRDQWRWSCVKPLHLECSYKLATVIFLFFPQKLAWPSSINVSLLRKRLGGAA